MKKKIIWVVLIAIFILCLGASFGFYKLVISFQQKANIQKEVSDYANDLAKQRNIIIPLVDLYSDAISDAPDFEVMVSAYENLESAIEQYQRYSESRNVPQNAEEINNLNDEYIRVLEQLIPVAEKFTSPMSSQKEVDEKLEEYNELIARMNELNQEFNRLSAESAWVDFEYHTSITTP